jgi:soluble lytic murein transglycosylase-like protein
MDFMAPTLYRTEIEGAAHEHGLEPDLVEGVVLTESSGRTDAFRYEPGFYERYLKGRPAWKDQIPRRISSSYGLMQVMYTTAVEHGFTGEPEELFIPKRGLDMGCTILAHLMEWSELDPMKALAAYNGGKGMLPTDYAKKVWKNYEAVKAERA